MENINFEAVELDEISTEITETAEAPEKKKGRGRPKKEQKPKTETAEAPKTETAAAPKIESLSVDDELKQLAQSYTPVSLPTQEEAPKRVLITGYMLLLVCDALIPNLIVMGLKRFKKVTIEAKKLKLTNDERKELEPLADEVAKMMLQEANPLIVFLFVYGSMTFGKIINEV
jgi:hypothetical protein